MSSGGREFDHSDRLFRPSKVQSMAESLDVDAMLVRFRERAAAVKRRQVPPVEGEARRDFARQAQLDFQDFAIVGDSTATIDDGVLILRIDLRGESGE